MVKSTPLNEDFPLDMEVEGIKSDAEIAKDVISVYGEEFLDSLLSSNEAKVSFMNDKAKVWRILNAFVGGSLVYYKDSIEGVFTTLNGTISTGRPVELLTEVANRLRWLVSEIYPKTPDRDLKKELAGFIVSADKIKALNIEKNWDAEFNGWRSMIMKNLAVYLHEINGRLRGLDKKQKEAAVGLPNNNLRTWKYLEEFMSKYPGIEGVERKLDNIAENEIGNDYQIFSRLLVKVNEDIANAESKTVLLDHLKTSELENVVELASVHKWTEVKKKFWSVRSVYDLHPVYPVLLPAFLATLGLKPIVLALIVVLAIVVIGVVIYLIVRAVRKEKMNIIPRSTLRRLNPYNQTFFV